MSEEKQVVDAKRALETIKQFVPSWTLAQESDITVSDFSKGYINTLYLVENKSKQYEGPTHVILRYYGGNFFDVKRVKEDENSFVKNTETEEVLVFFEQSERGLGPKLLGVFQGGRIEEYIPNHTLTPEESLEPAIMKDLAINFARFHSLKLPFPKDKIQRLELRALEKRDEKASDPAAMAAIFGHPDVVKLGIDFSKILMFDFKGEFAWIFSCFKAVAHRPAFITFDTNFLNRLVRDNVSDGQLRTVFVDYEMSFYSIRGIDIGGHFVNTIIKWNGKDNKSSGHPFPSEEKRREFVKYYLDECEQLKDYEFDSRDTVDHVLEESEVGALFFALLFSVFTLKAADKFIKEPSFFTVTPLLQQFYSDHKKACKEKYPHWP